jgi:hypothetical protein
MRDGFPSQMNNQDLILQRAGLGGCMHENSRKRRTNSQSQPDSHSGHDRVSLAMPQNDSPRRDSDLIALRAYQRYEARGREDGHDMDDWLTAENELRGGSTRSGD